MAASENVVRTEPHHGPPSTEENRPQISAGPSNTMEERKRKRIHENEPSEPQTARKPGTPSHKRRVVDASHERSASKPRQPQLEEPKRSPQRPDPPQHTPENPEPQQTQHTEPYNIFDTTHDPENEVDPLLIELPFLPPSPEPEEAPEQDIDTWIDERIKNGRATLAQVGESLRCTSMDPELADKVLHRLVSGKGIPTDTPGVWTAEDDMCIEGKDGRGIDRVLKKHGTEFFNARWEYLSLARDAGLIKS